LNVGGLDSSGAGVSDGGMLVAVCIGKAVAATGVSVDAGEAQPEITSKPTQDIVKKNFFIPNLLRKQRKRLSF
jgi:hypothetical protein